MLASATGIAKDSERVFILIMITATVFTMAVTRLTYREKDTIASIRTRTFIIDKCTAHTVSRFIGIGRVTTVIYIAERFINRIKCMVRIITVQDTIAFGYITRAV